MTMTYGLTTSNSNRRHGTMPNGPSKHPTGPQNRQTRGVPLRSTQHYRSPTTKRPTMRTKPPPPTTFGVDEDVDELERSQEALLHRRKVLEESLEETSSLPGSRPPQRTSNPQHRESPEQTGERLKPKPSEHQVSLVINEELPSYEGVRVPELLDSDDEEAMPSVSRPRGSKRINPPAGDRRVYKPPTHNANKPPTHNANGLKRPRKVSEAPVSPKQPSQVVKRFSGAQPKLHEWKEEFGRESETYAIEVLHMCNEEMRAITMHSHPSNAGELVIRCTGLMSKVLRLLELHPTCNRIQSYGIEILSLAVTQDAGNSSRLLAHGGGHVLVAALRKASADGDETCFEAVLCVLRHVVVAVGRREKHLLMTKGLLKEVSKLMQHSLNAKGSSRLQLTERQSLHCLEITRSLCYKNRACVRPAQNTGVVTVLASGLSRDIKDRNFERVGLSLALLRSLSDGNQKDKVTVFFASARYSNVAETMSSMLVETILRFQYCGDRDDLEQSVWVTERCLSTVEMLSRPSKELSNPSDDCVCSQMVKKNFPVVVLAALKLHMQHLGNLKPEARAATPTYCLLILDNLTRAQPRCIKALKAEDLRSVLVQLDNLAREYGFTAGPKPAMDRLLQRCKRRWIKST